MREGADLFIAALLVGTGATAVMDLWSLAKARLCGLPSLDYGLVGRWLAYLPRGRWRHDSIADTPPVHGERVIGWAAHYAIGIVFAGLLIGGWGRGWLCHPTPGPALLVGIGTVAAPFLLMQPAMGAGFAARRTPRPWVARGHSLLTHAVFGLGLFVAGWSLRLVGLVHAGPC